MQPDISIILNVHNEAMFLQRTLLSICEAALFARYNNITCELIIVLDRAAPDTRRSIEDFHADVFTGIRLIEVNNGSLGLSRNDGIAAATGSYITTADADDLISYNMFYACLHAARASSENTAIFPNYYFSFGDRRDHIWKYYGDDHISPLHYFSYHPYLSRVFASRGVFDKFHYRHVAPATGYAYEDWEFNTRIAAAGCAIKIAEDTVLFYRLRQNSLMQSSNVTARIPPASDYYHPATYLNLCKSAYEKGITHYSTPSEYQLRREVAANHTIQELTYAASLLEPQINVGNFQTVTHGSNRSGNISPSFAYYELCQQVEDNYTDVVLLPFLSLGGGEKYLLNVVKTLCDQNDNCKILIILGEPYEDSQSIIDLPDGTTILDVNRHIKDESAIDLITFRLIKSVAPKANIHYKDSHFTQRFFANYAKLLNESQNIFYRFCDNFTKYPLGMQRDFTTFNFLSEYGFYFDRIICDSSAIIKHDVMRLDQLADKYTLLPLVTETDSAAYQVPDTPHKRLIWASRLDAQKRPDLLIKLAQQLSQIHPEVIIDVYGSSVFREFKIKDLNAVSSIRYKGKFHGFSNLPYQDYDALIYTSAFDGLPNIILEAMSVGIPVIAPDIGGISDVLNGSTGILLESSIDDDVLVTAYVTAIEQILGRQTNLQHIVNQSRSLIAERHGQTQFEQQIQNIFSDQFSGKHAAAYACANHTELR